MVYSNGSPMNTSTAFRLRLPRPLFEEILAHARSELPNECCGFLAGRISEDGSVADAAIRYPLVNERASATEFLAEYRGVKDALRDMDGRRIHLLAVYHSHPSSEPIPSRRDLEFSFGEKYMTLIIGLADEEPAVRGWWLAATDYREGEWEVVPVSDATK